MISSRTLLFASLAGFVVVSLTGGSVPAAPLAPAKAIAKDCPRTDLGEAPVDCPWGGAARLFQRTAEGGKKIPANLFGKATPGLRKQIVADSHRDVWKRLWGQSINFDENAKGIIVEPAILESIARSMKISPAARPAPAAAGTKGLLVHAGMEHTYGYLFSTLQTPYGYKRARWVRNIIESGFGLPEGTFGPAPKQGTLFSNVTYFTGRIAFRNQPAALAHLTKNPNWVAKPLRTFPYADLKIATLEETVDIPAAEGVKARQVKLRTDLVQFTSPSSDPSNTHLLIYSIVDPTAEGAKLITAFPVQQSFLNVVFKPENLGEGKNVITRYNGYVEGLTGRSLTGTRTGINAPAIPAAPSPSKTP